MDIDSSEELKEAVEKLASLTKKIEGNSQVDSTEAENNDPLDRMVKHFEPSFDQMGANRLQNILEMDLPRPKGNKKRNKQVSAISDTNLALHGYDTNQTSSIAGGAVVIVVAICGILLVLLVVGVVKMRDDPILQRRRSRRDSFVRVIPKKIQIFKIITYMLGMGRQWTEHEFDVESVGKNEQR
jgi:hypothetical protein